MSARAIALWLIFCLSQLVCPIAMSAQGLTAPQFAAQSASRSSYFIDAAGSLYVWGQNTHGQLGIGNTNNQLAPIRISFPNGVTAWKSAAAGERHAMVIANNDQLYVWGDNSHGQLGISPTNANPPQIKTRPELVLLSSGSAGWKAIAAGGQHSLAIDSNDRLFSWGDNESGQLGTGSTLGTNSPVMVDFPAGVSAWRSVAAGESHSLAIGNDGNLYAWGANDYGQLGIGSITNRATPQRVPLPPNTTAWQSVVAGLKFTLAMDKVGNLFVWGQESLNVLKVPYVVEMPNSVEGWVTMACGGAHYLALGSDGKLYAAGNNDFGQLGLAVRPGFTSPQGITTPPEMTGWYLLGAGQEHSLAVGNDCKLYSWGANAQGELGDGTRTNRSTPSPIDGMFEVCSATATNLATVNVTTTISAVGEYVPNTGFPVTARFIISRTGNTTEELDVSFSLGGKALIGIDYEEITRSVRLSKGVFARSITITPMDDILLEGDEGIVLTLEPPPCLQIQPPPDNCYRIGPQGEAAITIVDDERAGNSPPEIAITAPPNGSVFRAPASIDIWVHATHKNGDMYYYEIYEGLRRLAAVSFVCEPGGCTDVDHNGVWQSVPPGNYTLTARVASSGKQVGISEPINILVVGTTNFPVVDLFSIRRGLDGAMRFRINGTASQAFITQASTNLISWTAISTNIFVSTTFDILDDHANRYDRRFYRAVPLP